MRSKLGTRSAVIALGALLSLTTAGIGYFSPAAYGEESETGSNTGSKYEVISSGHVDIFDGTSTGKDNLVLQIRSDANNDQGTARTPESVIFEVGKRYWKDKNDFGDFAEKVPGGAALLPVTQENNSLWPGWDLDETKLEKSEGGVSSSYRSQVDIVFDEVSVPKGGRIYLFGPSQSGDFLRYLQDAQAKEATEMELISSRFIRDANLSHTHVNWVFTTPGVYQFKVHLRDSTPKNVDKEGKYLCSRVATYTVRVQDRSGNLPKTVDNQIVGTAIQDQGCRLSTGESLDKALGGYSAPSFAEILGIAADRNEKEEKEKEKEKAPETDKPESENKTEPAPVKVGEQCYATPVGKVSSNAGGSHAIAYNSHVHFMWGFTAPGRYQLQLVQTFKHKNGQTVSVPTPLTFIVGGSGNANSGHYDIGLQVEANGSAKPVVKTDDRGTLAANSLTFGLGERAKETLRADIPGFASAGTTIWAVPKAQIAGVPWIGANTMEASFRQYAASGVTWSLQAVNGPGKVAIYDTSGLSSQVSVWMVGNASANSSVKPGQVVSGGVIYEGRTSSGQPCQLSAETVAGLANTGSDPLILGLLALAGGIGILGLGVYVARRSYILNTVNAG